MIDDIVGYARCINCWIMGIASSVGLLAARLWLAWIFFKAGLLKIANWNGTLYLFQQEYNVPLLPPVLAAYAGTAAELVLPVFLVLGLATHLNALALFMFNAVAVYSYWHGLPPVGVQDHVIWAVLLLILMLQGAGKVSLDALLCHWIKRHG